MATGPHLTQAEVNYRDAVPGSSMRCGSCSMYRVPHRCTLVEGDIQKDGVCDRFATATGVTPAKTKPTTP